MMRVLVLMLLMRLRFGLYIDTQDRYVWKTFRISNFRIVGFDFGRRALHRISIRFLLFLKEQVGLIITKLTWLIITPELIKCVIYGTDRFALQTRRAILDWPYTHWAIRIGFSKQYSCPTYGLSNIYLTFPLRSKRLSNLPIKGSKCLLTWGSVNCILVRLMD